MSTRCFIRPVCPFSNRILIILNLLHIDFTTMLVSSKKKLQAFTQNDCFTDSPCLIYNNIKIFGSENIIHFLYEKYNNQPLLKNYDGNLNIIHWDQWMNTNIYFNIYYPLFFDKSIKDFYDYKHNIGEESKHAAKQMLNQILEDLDHSLKLNTWMNQQNNLSINDVTAFSFLSTMDYLGLIQWQKYLLLKQWYMRMKSHNSFNAILKYELEFKPVKHYMELDF